MNIYKNFISDHLLIYCFKIIISKMEYEIEKRLLANVADFELAEANVEQIDISDEVADYDLYDFYRINDFENQEEDKWILTNLLKMDQCLNKDKCLLSFLNQENI